MADPTFTAEADRCGLCGQPPVEPGKWCAIPECEHMRPAPTFRPGFPVTVAGYAPYEIAHPFRAVVVREGNEGVFVGFSYGGPATTEVVEVPVAEVALDVAAARTLAAQLTDAIAAATHRPSPRPGSYRFSPPDGDPVRVVIAGDVIALPEEGWSLGGFGRSISEEWLLTQARPRIPGTKARRLVLVACIRAALEEHYGAGKESADAP